MILVLLGMPGSGKGTQAKKISGKYNIPHISTGDIFREVLAGSSPVAEKIRKYVNSGMLVPDDIVFDIARERISRDDCSQGCLLDGFPRNVNQAENLDSFLRSAGKTLPLVIYLELSFEESVRRLTARRNCPVCRKDYNMVSMPPANDGICDTCGVKLVSRKDDEEGTVKKRLEVYREETLPLVDFYDKKKSLLRVNAADTVEAIFRNICSLVDKVANPAV
jgi:adenylate kinase